METLIRRQGPKNRAQCLKGLTMFFFFSKRFMQNGKQCRSYRVLKSSLTRVYIVCSEFYGMFLLSWHISNWAQARKKKQKKKQQQKKKKKKKKTITCGPSEDSDQTPPNLIWVFAARTGYFVTCCCVLLKYTRKFPKYSDTQKIRCNHSKIWTMWLYHRVMSPNDADGMANSVDLIRLLL